MSECGENIAAQGDVTRQQAEEILQRIRNLAQQRIANGESAKSAVDAVTQQLQSHDRMMAAMNARNVLLQVQSKRDLKDFVGRFKDLGTGLMAFLEGRQRDIKGARNSVDYQIKATNNKYFGRMVAELDQAGVLREFRTNELTKEIYQEMGELGKENGQPGISKSPAAQKIASIVDGITQEMVARQNRAGSYIGNLPGYIVRQTHNMDAVRAEGRLGSGTLSKEASYQAWKNFTTPLLNQADTFMGADPEKFMRNVHEGIYSGVHGSPTSEWTVGGWGVRGDLAKRASQERVLHFADADSAWNYNEKFGTKDFRQQVLTDIHNRSRSIGLMENLGPAPEENLTRAMRELKEEARTKDNAAQLVDSINDHKVMSSFRQLTGVNNIPANPTLARLSGNLRIVAQLSKMGSVLLTNLFSDRAFLQSEMAYQGINNLTTLAKQVTGLAKRSQDEKQMLRLMGVGMDGLMGNALARFSDETPIGGMLDKAQKKFFDINFHNYWTDSTKSSAAELMAAHLGEHAGLEHDKLPEELARVLKLYDIGAPEWDAMRSVATKGPREQTFITPDMLSGVNDEAIQNILASQDRKVTPTAIQRARDQLDTQLRTYIADRVDMAVPTPGASERRIATGDTRVGTPLGEAVRLMMIFKSFPLAVMNKILTREIYGRGAGSAMEWLMNDHQGKFHMASLIAMTTMAGYMSLVLHDAVAGKTPRDLASDGKVNMDVLNEAAIRGGGLGLMGDLIMREYGDHTSSFLEAAGGPVVGQADLAARTFSKGIRGEPMGQEVGKILKDNTPLINLFYVRPILNYYVLWNLETMMDPGRARKMEQTAERNHQRYFMGPGAQ